MFFDTSIKSLLNDPINKEKSIIKSKEDILDELELKNDELRSQFLNLKLLRQKLEKENQILEKELKFFQNLMLKIKKN